MFWPENKDKKRDILRVILIVSISMGLFLGIWVGFARVTVSEKSNVEGISVDTGTLNIQNQNQTCDVANEIEYLHYVERNENDIQNNKFGLYIYAEDIDFIKLTDELVNSNGGDWGYVLIPYNVASDRDFSKWHRVFETLFERHLIPIIQLHDVNVDDYKNQTEDVAEFLNSFIWPVKERYISVYNEPNDSKFWYGEVNPAEYAEILNYTVETFKAENANFFMLNGALNVSASNGNGYLDAFEFMNSMNDEVPGIFEKLDGWASHSYPQPNFSGSPNATGRWSIRAYESELDYLKNNLGVDKELPVFITETGWAHAEGENWNETYLSVDEVSRNFEVAYEEVWLPDDRVQAVTPFTIWYKPPFDHFAWVNRDKVPYKHFDVIKELDKITGTPRHLVLSKVVTEGCE